MEHPAVAKGVIGKPVPVAGECGPRGPEARPSPPELRRELLALARTRLGAVVAPKEIEFHGPLPKTRSGNIMRRSC